MRYLIFLLSLFSLHSVFASSNLNMNLNLSYQEKTKTGWVEQGGMQNILAMPSNNHHWLEMAKQLSSSKPNAFLILSKLKTINKTSAEFKFLIIDFNSKRAIAFDPEVTVQIGKEKVVELEEDKRKVRLNVLVTYL